MTIPSWLYRDPAEIYERMESRTCAGCIYKARLWGADYCVNGEWEGAKNERRCKQYREATHGHTKA